MKTRSVHRQLSHIYAIYMISFGENSLVDNKLPRSDAVHLFELSDDLRFWWENVDKYDRKFTENTTQTLFKVLSSSK